MRTIVEQIQLELSRGFYCENGCRESIYRQAYVHSGHDALQIAPTGDGHSNGEHMLVMNLKIMLEVQKSKIVFHCNTDCTY